MFGLAIGGLFALAFAAVYGRVGRASPARTALWLAAAAYVVVFLVPFIKYPSNPPAVGNPDTIGRRTLLYVCMIVISLLAAYIAVKLRATYARRVQPATATLLAIATYAVIVLVAGLVPAGRPRDPCRLPRRDAVAVPRVDGRHAGDPLGDHRPRLRRARAAGAGRQVRSCPGVTARPHRSRAPSTDPAAGLKR